MYGLSFVLAFLFSAVTTADNASFSCKIDGKDFSGSGTDQYVNAAQLHSPGVLYFTLSPAPKGDPIADIKGGGIGFEVPDKGTTVIKGIENPDYSIGYSPVNQPTVNYSCEQMTVTIHSTGSRVSGTFSGSLIEQKTGRKVLVTDGKFDIPFSKISGK